MQRAGWIARRPQEGLCQALGLPGTLKYESDGGPGMSDILRVLHASLDPLEDKRAFLKAQMVFWLLAAPDGHAKNFSIFIERGGSHRLTPFHDVLSAWPIIGRGASHLDWRKAKLAMAVRSKNAHWKISELKPHSWDAIARFAGLGGSAELLTEIISAAPRAVEEAHREIKPGFPAEIRDKIFNGFLTTVRSLRALF
ncbi:MAG: HipA domain-containing protein, partial [Opitutaceae bacterium]